MDYNLDNEQNKVIQSTAKKIIVEAPAGFGKTYTMICMLDSWIQDSLIKNNKKILCLSFSLSAVNRMRDSLRQLQKDIPENTILPIFATNYHGLGRRILSKYGNFVGLSQSIDNYENTENVVLPQDVNCEITTFKNNIKNDSLSEKQLLIEIEKYNNYLREYYLPKSIIPFDGIITLTIELFQKYFALRNFYRSYYTAICIDEFQDTNRLQLAFIHILMGEDARFVAFGDSMQHIYGFIGAIDNLIDEEILDDTVEYIRLKNNYRFKNSYDMNLLDQNLRSFHKNMNSYIPQEVPYIETIHGTNLQDEANKLAKVIKKVTLECNERIAILFSQNLTTTKELLRYLESENITFYNGLFKEDNKDFIKFQESTFEAFQKRFARRTLRQTDIAKFMSFIKQNSSVSEYLPSFLSLLEGLLKKAVSSVESINRNNYVNSILSQKILNQSVDEIMDAVYVNTIHGSKGLEWEYVVVANFENNEFPNYHDMQDISTFSKEGQLIITDTNHEAVQTLINKFYVAFSRAKKKVLLSYSDYHWEGRRKKAARISCLADISVLKIKEIHFEE